MEDQITCKAPEESQAPLGIGCIGATRQLSIRNGAIDRNMTALTRTLNTLRRDFAC